MKKNISILGSTGSVGLNTLKILKKKKDYFKPFLFSANKNLKLISSQIIKYQPKYFVINDEKTFQKIFNKFIRTKVKIKRNYEDINFKSKRCITISAIPGIAGLNPILKAINFSEKLLIANKEAVICGWNLIKKKAKKNKTKLIPIDSEHYSILKLLENQDLDNVNKIYLTASGGPFLNFKPKNLKFITPKQALQHPKWKMGKKISVDSSTLMNKVFEIVEAQKIFDIPYDKLDIIIHPNSLVHAILELKNGLKKLIYHDTSMKIPLANAIFDGKLEIDNFLKKKNNKKFQDLLFRKVDKKVFPCFFLKQEINRYPSTAIIVNAANEVLVDQFLSKKIQFLDIYKIIKMILKDANYKKYAIRKPKNIKQIYQIDLWARNLTLKKILKD